MTEQTNASLDSPTAAAMMPLLPSGRELRVAEGGSSFEDRALLLISAAVRINRLLTLPAYELAVAAVRRVFGDRANQADLQARFHDALLHPPADPVALAEALARDAVAESVSSERVRALLAGMEECCPRTGKGGDVALREALELAFAERGLEVRRRQLDDGANEWTRGAEWGLEMSLRAGRAVADGTRRVLDTLTGLGRRWLPSEDGRAFPAADRRAALAGGVESLERALWPLGEEQSLRELAEFRALLAPQPFRVVLAGEGKRGKSSLINAFLGEEWSPVRESVPETAAVAEFFYAPMPRYAVTFLDEEHFAHIDQYVRDEAENLLLRHNLEAWRKLAERRPTGEATLSCRAEIADYLSAGGRYSSLVAQVSVGLPAELLRLGMVLVDTPGLNAADAFRNYRTWEESLRADCLLFFLDARRPDSGSELELLRRLAASGRAVSLIGVLTGGDRLNDPGSLPHARERALDILRETCRGAEGLRLCGLVSLNARELMRERCGSGRLSPENRKEWEKLLDYLREVVASGADERNARIRLKARADRLAEDIRARGRDALARYEASLPSPSFLDMLGEHSRRLEEAVDLHVRQARAVVAAAARDVDLWRVEQLQALDLLQERLVGRVMEAARRHADSLGPDFARASGWVDFDQREAPAIAQECLDEFLTVRRASFHAWNEKLRLFQQQLHEISLLCLQSASVESERLKELCTTSGNMEYWLVRGNRHMRQLAVLLGGVGVGVLGAGSVFGLAALGGAALMVLTHPLFLPGAALAGIAALTLRKFGDEKKRKAAFLDRKQARIAQWAAETRRHLEQEMDSAHSELASAYREAVTRGFIPALEILTDEATHIHLYLDVMNEIRKDSALLEANLQRRLEELKAEVSG